MSSVVISGDTSGSVTLQAPAVSGSTVLTLPATSGTVLTSTSATVGSGGITFSDGSIQTAAASPYVLKNRIINGGMDIWQRGTTGFTSGYTADRWFTTGGSSVTVARSTDTQTGYRYALAYSGSNYGGISQRIESYNTQDLVGQNATLSFWAKSISGDLGVAIVASYPTAQDNYTSATTISTEYIALTTSWAKYTISYSTLASGVANGIQINIFGSSGSATAFNLTGVQLEIGTSATPFERRLINQELANCQRYYYRVSPTTSGDYFGSGYNYSTTQSYVAIPFPVTMRTNPTALEQSGTAANYEIMRAGGNTACTSVPTFEKATLYGSTTIFTASGFTAGQGILGRMLTNGYLGWSAEL